MNKGLFITIEGSEGAGKSTAIKALAQQLDQWNIKYVLTREPGGEKNAEAIRNVLLNTDHLHAETELLLMFAARNEHLNKVIKPALELGKWVLCDRFIDASYAYQGGGRELPIERLDYLTNWIAGSCLPDLTYLLDINPEQGFKRIAGRQRKDRIEQEQLAFFNRVRSVYLQRAKIASDRFVIIDAMQNMNVVHSELLTSLRDFKNRHE